MHFPVGTVEATTVISLTRSEHDMVLVEHYRCAEGNPITFVHIRTLSERKSLPADRVESELMVLKAQYPVSVRSMHVGELGERRADDRGASGR